MIDAYICLKNPYNRNIDETILSPVMQYSTDEVIYLSDLGARKIVPLFDKEGDIIGMKTASFRDLSEYLAHKDVANNSLYTIKNKADFEKFSCQVENRIRERKTELKNAKKQS